MLHLIGYLDMSTPSIFFSHSSQDQKSLVQIKDLFMEKTGGAIEVFLSSDGQSIPLGRNWVHRVEEALNSTKLMFIFLTPAAIRSNWVYFEAGYVYSKGIRVVPIGFLGVDLAKLPPPLSLLQGFNVTSEDGLNNIIALVNDEFKHRHMQRFKSQEYSDIVNAGGNLRANSLGAHAQAVDEISIYLSEGREIANASLAFAKAKELIIKEDLVFHAHEYLENLHFTGCQIQVNTNTSPLPLEIRIDPGLIDYCFARIDKLLTEIRSEGASGISIAFTFKSSIGCLWDKYKISSRLFGSEASIADDGDFSMRDLKFAFHATFREPLCPILGIKTQLRIFPLQQLGDLLNLLFDRGVFYYDSK